MVQVNSGVLITADEATVVFILYLDECQSGSQKFVVRQLDARRLFIKADRVSFIKDKLAERLAETTYDGEDAAPLPE